MYFYWLNKITPDPFVVRRLSSLTVNTFLHKLNQSTANRYIYIYYVLNWGMYERTYTVLVVENKIQIRNAITV